MLIKFTSSAASYHWGTRLAIDTFGAASDCPLVDIQPDVVESSHRIFPAVGFRSPGNHCERYAKSEMVKIYSPNDEVELSMIRGLLDSAGIHFFIHNDYFGSMEVGPQIELFNRKAIMVAQEDAEQAKRIIAEFLDRELPEEERIALRYSLGQKLRMIFESLLFWWFVPGKRKRTR